MNSQGKMRIIHLLVCSFFFSDKEESEEDDDDDDDEGESTEESTKMEVDTKQKQNKTEQTPKTSVRNVQIFLLFHCHVTEHYEFWFCHTYRRAPSTQRAAKQSPIIIGTELRTCSCFVLDKHYKRKISLQSLIRTWAYYLSCRNKLYF